MTLHVEYRLGDTSRPKSISERLGEKKGSILDRLGKPIQERLGPIVDGTSATSSMTSRNSNQKSRQGGIGTRGRGRGGRLGRGGPPPSQTAEALDMELDSYMGGEVMDTRNIISYDDL